MEEPKENDGSKAGPSIFKYFKQSKKDKKVISEDYIQVIIGSIGKYQIYQTGLMFLSKFWVAFHQMSIIFIAPKTTYVCGDTGNETCPCDQPIYDTSTFPRTIITEWHLICNRRSLTSFNQMSFQFGTLIGSLLFGMASDRYGRKYPLFGVVVLQASMGITAAFIKDYWWFTFIRFLTGLAVGGSMVCTFVIVMELTGTKYRSTISALYQAVFNMGHMLLPVFSYFFRDYSDFLLALSIPSLLLLLYIVLVPESPRWLIAVKKTEQGIKILERIAKINKRPTENIKATVDEFDEANFLKRRLSVVDLFRTPNLRKNILAMSFNWLTCSYCFYGVSQYVGQLSGNIFVNVLASATVTFCGTILSIPLLTFFGRKTLLITFEFICAGCLFGLTLVPDGAPAVVLATIGVVASFVVFVVVYLYCSELFPTVVRNAAIGFSSMMARVGSMIAPFVLELGIIRGWLPPVVFAVFPLTAGFVTFLLPETKGSELMTTIEEGENFKG